MRRLMSRSVVDFPHPDGPHEDQDLAAEHVHSQVVDRWFFGPAVLLGDVF